jgi:hypothetical protein
MFTKFFVALCLMALCVTVHAAGLTVAFRWVDRRPGLLTSGFWPSTWTLIRVAGWTISLHAVEIAIWAAFYTW